MDFQYELTRCEVIIIITKSKPFFGGIQRKSQNYGGKKTAAQIIDEYIKNS